MGFFLKEPIDIDRHNEDVRAVWAAYNAGLPTRVPVSVGGSIRYFLQNPALNSKGWTFKDYFEKLDVQIEAQVEYRRWCRYNLLCDQEMGLPEYGWQVSPDFQNSLESAWAGCPMVYPAGAVPDTLPTLAAGKEKLYDMPQRLDDSSELFSRALEFYDGMLDAADKRVYHRRPLLPPQAAPGEGTDGPLDLAYKLRGAENLLIDMLTDETYYHDLMTYVTENIIRRIKRMKEYRWHRQPESTDLGQYKRNGFFFADDAIALLSPRQYQEFVYPYHKCFFEEFSTGVPASIHLCGSATQHFRFLRDAFNITTFDTGFPVDHGALRRELGEDVTIYGGPTIMEVMGGTPESIEREVERICHSGIMKGGRFVMIAANNLAPFTPVENIQALYEATKKHGQYSRMLL